MFGNRNMKSEQEFEILEAHLAGTLKRVPPPSGIVQRLKERVKFVPRGQVKLRLRDWRTMFLIFGGVMSGMLAILTLARAVYYLVGRKASM
jgi:hypothetical protein